MLMLLMLPMAFPLPPSAQAEEIIGGREARPHSRPYMAFVNIEIGGGVERRCGGFLIRQDVVVTAAHCNCKLCNMTVLLGAHDIAVQELGMQEIQVCHQISHPEYDDETLENDIMLLKLARPAELNDCVRLIKLPKAKQRVKPGTKCSVAGWGKTNSDSEEESDVLMEVELSVKQDKFCMKHYEETYTSKTMLCAGCTRAPGGTLEGDSGGPLVCGDVAQGICSWDFAEIPAEVYTRVSYFVPWIQEMMKKLPH